MSWLSTKLEDYNSWKPQFQKKIILSYRVTGGLLSSFLNKMSRAFFLVKVVILSLSLLYH